MVLTESMLEQAVIDGAAGFLAADEDPQIAQLLRECQGIYWEEPDQMLGLIDEDFAFYYPLRFVKLYAPGWVYRPIKDDDLIGRIWYALEQTMDISLRDVRLVMAEPDDVEDSNQAPDLADGVPTHVWSGLRFRSRSEVRVAEALERAGVTFFPNCRGRIGPADGREVREPDFLVIHSGKAGVIEIDGEPWHPAERAAIDHARDRLFRSNGTRVVERFDAREAYNDPDLVVAEFLQILQRS